MTPDPTSTPGPDWLGDLMLRARFGKPPAPAGEPAGGGEDPPAEPTFDDRIRAAVARRWARHF